MDNKEANHYYGVKLGSRVLNPCRICFNPEGSFSVHEAGDLRTNALARSTVERAEAAVLKRLGAFKNQRNVMNAVETQALKICYNMSLHPIKNPLYEHVAIFKGRVLLSELFPFDKLHTFLKGVVQNTICWVVSLVAIVCKFHPNKTAWAGNIGRLDRRMKNFCRHSGIYPFDNFNFEGVSCHF